MMNLFFVLETQQDCMHNFNLEVLRDLIDFMSSHSPLVFSTSHFGKKSQSKNSAPQFCKHYLHIYLHTHIYMLQHHCWLSSESLQQEFPAFPVLQLLSFCLRVLLPHKQESCLRQIWTPGS